MDNNNPLTLVTSVKAEVKQGDIVSLGGTEFMAVSDSGQEGGYVRVCNGVGPDCNECYLSGKCSEPVESSINRRRV